MDNQPDSTLPTVTLRRLIPAAPEEVFDAWTKPEMLKQWLSPYENVDTEVEVDFRVGGRFTFSMRGPDGVCTVTGEYLEIRQPQRLVFTWSGTTTRDQITLVTVEFLEKDGKTELILTHEKLPTQDSRESYSQGWATIIEHLLEYVSMSGT